MSKNFNDMMEETESQLGEDLPSTPSARRVVEDAFDPRSPTQGISRTPIQLERGTEGLVDPRSPTCGIDRTPISYQQHADADSATAADAGHLGQTPSVATVSFPPEPSQQSRNEPPEESGFHSDNSIELMSRSSSEPDLSKDQQVLIKPRKSATPGKTSKPQSIAKKHKPKALFQGHTNTGTENKSSSSGSKVKEARSPLRVLGDSDSRSPLGRRNVDVNSPRVIVQRKQTTKLGMLRAKTSGAPTAKAAVNSGSLSCRYEAMSDDKENISM